MRLAWNLIITGAREINQDWTKILESGQLLKPQYQGKNQAGATPIGNNASSQQQGYVGLLSSSNTFQSRKSRYDMLFFKTNVLHLLSL